VNGRVCVLGSFMMDLIARAPRRPRTGETLVGTGFGMHLGGKGVNQAVAAARVGAEVAMIGRVGADDFGRRFLEALSTEGIDATHVGTDPDVGTGVGLPVVHPSGDNSIIIVPQANSRVGVADVTAAAEAITAADVLVLQFELPLETAVAAARIAREAGTIVVLNPAPATTGTERLRGLVDHLLPNAGEAEELSGVVTDGDDGRAAAAALRASWGATGVIVTLGERGVLVVDDDGDRHVPAFDVVAVDTVGAGDAFAGGLAARLAVGDDLDAAVAYARTVAALSCTREGAVDAMPTAADVAAALAEADGHLAQGARIAQGVRIG